MTLAALPIAQQWTLHKMQLVNWGCFDGYHPVTFAGPQQVTLITGSTGTGKSTLLDAHIVLMHDPSTALNRASNATVRRSRSGETRNVVSYMRGVHGQTRDVDGERDMLLREGSVWSAIAETWRSTDGGILTAVSAFFSTANDTNRPGLRRDAWIRDEFDLRWLEQFATGTHVETPFPPRAMEKAYPGLAVVPSTRALHRALWQELGIGDEGDGKNAMELLYKVQSADAVQSVNDLFTKFVLDQPCTYPAAEEAEKHFAKLRESRERVRVIEDQTTRLVRIPGLWNDYETGRDAVAFFAQVAPTIEPAVSPFWKWRRDRESVALEDAETAATREHQQAVRDQKAAADEAERLEGQWRDLSAAIGQHAGLAQLAGVDADIRAAKEALGRAENARAVLAEALGQVLAVPAQRSAYDRQRAASSAFLAGFKSAAKQAADALEGAKREQWRLSERLGDLRQERRHYEGRHDVVGRDHDWIRNRYATVVGLTPAELPYAGELVDMLPEYEDWRMAAEKVLGGTATSLLVPESHLAAFRRAANDELTAYRIPYLTVRGAAAPKAPADPATIAGRLQYRDHPYSAWLSERLTRTARHLCVDSPDELGDLPAGRTDAVTVKGQTANRDGGVVGGQKGHRPTIGFSPETALASVDAQIASVEAELGPVDATVHKASADVAELNAKEKAHTRFLETDWDTIDTHGAEARLRDLTGRKKALESDPTAKTLLDQQMALRSALGDAHGQADKHSERAQKLHEKRAALADRKDAAFDHLTAMEGVPDPDMGRLDSLLDAYRDDPDTTAPTASDFEDGPWRKFVRHLSAKYEEAERSRATAREYLAKTFEDYLRDYADTPGAEDLTTDPDRSYWQFLAIHDRHVASGVEGAKADFTQYAAEYGGHELTRLSMAYQTERDLIDARLGEIRAALSDQPYGPTSTGRVSIEVRDGHAPAEVAAFRAALHTATSGATAVLSYDEAVAKFTVFDRLISQMSDPRTRDTLLDVRRHIVLEAQHLDGGTLVSFHRDLGTKSGGETQELTMFIIAAAIRYRVGSVDATTPRFAPVFMDEGLIKADPERTRRAVNVWTHLGFQPIIATTTDKHESVSRAATVLLSVSKDSNQRSRIDAAVEESPERSAIA